MFVEQHGLTYLQIRETEVDKHGAVHWRISEVPGKESGS